MRTLTAAIAAFSFGKVLTGSVSAGSRPFGAIVRETLAFDGIRGPGDFGNVDPSTAAGFDSAVISAVRGAAEAGWRKGEPAAFQDLATAAIAMRNATAAVPEVWAEGWVARMPAHFPKVDHEVVSVFRVASETLRAAALSGHPLAWTAGVSAATRILESVGIPGPSFRKQRRKRIVASLRDPEEFLDETLLAVLESCNRELAGSGKSPSGTVKVSELAGIRGKTRAYVRDGFSWIDQDVGSAVAWSDPAAVDAVLESAAAEVVRRWA